MRKDALVESFIHVENYIPAHVCRSLMPHIKDLSWQQHYWSYKTPDGKLHSYIEEEKKEKELDMADATPDLQSILVPYVMAAIKEYANKRVHRDPDYIVTTFSPIRFNRYAVGTLMRPHIDHIHTIFDGVRKGVPTLSIVGVLNDDYSGGEFKFFGDYELPLTTGDILIFPSNFMYPHEVCEVTQGERHSFVSWAF